MREGEGGREMDRDGQHRASPPPPVDRNNNWCGTWAVGAAGGGSRRVGGDGRAARHPSETKNCTAAARPTTELSSTDVVSSSRMEQKNEEK